MTEDRIEYICTKCKTPIHLSKPNRFCVCGGLLQARVPSNIDDLLGDILKGKYNGKD